MRHRGHHPPHRAGRHRQRDDPDASVHEAPRPGLERLRALRPARPTCSSCGSSWPTRARTRDIGWSDRLERHRDEVEHRLAKIGAMIDVLHGDQEYAYRVTFRYSGDLKPLADYIEDVPGCEVLSARPLAGDHQGPQRRGERGRAVPAERLHRHARDRPRPDGHRVGRGHLRRPPVLGLPVLRHRRGAQRAADQLPHVAPQAGARWATGSSPSATPRSSPSTWPQKMDDGLSLETAMKQSLDELDGVFTYLVVTGRLARRGQGRDGRQAAGAVRVAGAGGARLRGGRDPRRASAARSTPTTPTSAKCWCGTGEDLATTSAAWPSPTPRHPGPPTVTTARTAPPPSSTRPS